MRPVHPPSFRKRDIQHAYASHGMAPYVLSRDERQIVFRSPHTSTPEIDWLTVAENSQPH